MSRCIKEMVLVPVEKYKVLKNETATDNAKDKCNDTEHSEDFIKESFDDPVRGETGMEGIKLEKQKKEERDISFQKNQNKTLSLQSGNNIIDSSFKLEQRKDKIPITSKSKLSVKNADKLLGMIKTRLSKYKGPKSSKKSHKRALNATPKHIKWIEF